jgi:hypothetical protein
VLPLLDAVAAAVGLATAVEAEAPGWLLLPDDAHPATAAAQISVTTVRAGRPALSRMMPPLGTSRLKPETTQAGIRLRKEKHDSGRPGESQDRSV